MRFSAPKALVWWLAVVLGGCGIAIRLGWIVIPALSGYSFWMVAAAFVLLALGTSLKGL